RRWRAGFFGGGAGYGFDGDGGYGGAVIQVDVFHGVVRVVVALAVDVVVLHEQDDRDAHIGEDLAIGVVERTSGVEGQADLIEERGVLRQARHRLAVWTSSARAGVSAAGALVPAVGACVPGHGRLVGLLGQPERVAADAWRDLKDVLGPVVVVGDHIENV